MSIVVLANYRTGSTALCDVLSRQNNLYNMDEFFHRDKYRTDYEFDILNSKNYVVKIMPDQIMEPYFSDLISESLVYGIYRRDVVKQIASHIICIQRNIWHYKISDQEEKYDIIIDKDHIGIVTDFILETNKRYNQKFKSLCEIEYIYEDITDLLNLSTNTYYCKPSNYQDLLHEIEIVYNHQLNL